MNSIERLTLETIGEDPDNPDVFTDDSMGMAQIRDSINDCIEEVAIVTGGYRETYQIALRSNRAFYRFDYHGGDIAWITDVFLMTNQRRLEQTDIHKLTTYNPRWMYDTAPPRAYMPIGLNHIGFWPKPSTDTDIVEISMVIVPSRYTLDTDRVKVRRDLEWSAANYAAGEYYASRGDAKTAIEHHTKYMQSIGIDAPYVGATAGYTRQLSSNKDPWPKDTG